MSRNNITFILLFMALIILLATLPINDIKIEINHHFGFLSSVRSQIEDMLHINISFSGIQNLLHIPFFSILSVMWMKFFRKNKVDIFKSMIYTLILTTLFSIFEESCQYFIARDASAKDLVFNFIGSLTGIGIFRYTGEKPQDGETAHPKSKS
ncbi:MAG: VanZ family protein [Desulfobacteraceae bacterium]|nr:MAG: VanZ family protein [Desulfobacteraceae bacterium]